MFRLSKARPTDLKRTNQALLKTRRSWFNNVVQIFNSSNFDEELCDHLEEVLISADVGVSTTQKLLAQLRSLIDLDKRNTADDALELLRQEMKKILDIGSDANPSAIPNATPSVFLMVGTNGVGKTTSVAKLAKLFKDDGKSVLIGAADTFRAAAIEQLKIWGEMLELDVIAHKHGSDPGAVAFDTYQAASARKADVVIIDTAGRLHTTSNLMEELGKIKRVLTSKGSTTPTTLLTLDATIGQNGLYQSRAFVEAVKCDGVFLAKMDGSAKGGIALSIAEDLNLPVLYVGTGEKSEDIAVFNPDTFVDSLLSNKT